MNFKTTDRALLALLRSALFESEEALGFPLEENEWKILITHADALGVLPPAFNGALTIPPTALPKHLPEAWSELAHRKLEHAETVLTEEAALVKVLRETHTPILFLADTAAAAYYPHPSLRTVRSTECLCERSIKAVADSLAFSSAFSEKQSLTVPKGESIEAIRLRSLLARALDTSTDTEIGDYTLPVPSVAVQALLLLLAAEKKPSLLLLADWAMLLHYAFERQEINLAMQVRAWEQCGLLDTAKRLSYTASLAFALDTAEWFEDANKEEAEQLLADALIPDEAKLLRAEKNLDIAIKRAERPKKALSVPKKKKQTNEKSAFSRLIGGFFGKK